MPVRRRLVAATVVLLTATALSGCNGKDSGSKAGPDGPSDSSAPSALPTEDLGPEVPSDTTLQQPRALATIAPKATLTAVPGASELPVTGLRTIQGFPVPPGVTVKDPGPLDDTWQFDLHSDDLDGLIAFYQRVLPQMGYRVRLGVSYTLGAEKVYWDIVFDGKVSGSMVRDPDHGVLFVVVNPPGQPAIAGEK
ncbi:MAG TPA: hypothetical protein VF416_03485 [Marmoricola sp.]